MGYVFDQTFTSANDGTNTSDYATVNVSPGRATYSPGPDQVLCVLAETSGAAGAATAEVVVIDLQTGLVIWQENATITPTTRRAATDNSSGNYIATVAFAVSGRNTVDLLAATAFSNEINKVAVKIGVTALGGHTSIVLRGIASGVI